MTRIIDPLEQFFDDAGNPLIDGLFYFYETGTNTLLDTFSDINLTTPNANPLPLTAAGRCPNAYGYNRLYRVVVKTSDGTQILQRDNVGSFSAESALSSWIYDKTYLKGELVTYNYKYYKSEVNGNKGNIPDAASQWSEVKFIQEYQSGVTYTDEIVQDNGLIYRSLQAANIGHSPASNPNWWELIGSIPKWANTRTYAQYERVYVGTVVYVSQQSNNLNHDPVADTSFTWWKPASRVDLEANPQLIKINLITGGGTLLAEWNNVIGDGNSGYLLPLANSVPANTGIIISKSDIARTLYPIITRSGSDTIAWLGGTDTSFQIDTQFADSMILYSNGSNQWSF